MTPEEEPSPSEKAAGPARPRRRSRRGGRGRRRPSPASGPAPAVSPVTSEPDETLAASESVVEEAPLPDSEIEEARREAAESRDAEQTDLRDEPPAAHRESRSERPEQIGRAHV